MDNSIRDTASQDVAIEKKGRRRWIWLVPVLAIVAVLALIAPALTQWLSTERTATRAQLRIATVKQQTFVRDVSAQGIVVAAVSPTIYASSAGTVTLHVKAGDAMKQGDLIAEIDSPELNNEVEREQATLSSLETNLQRQTIENKKLNLAAQQTADLANIQLTASERELRRAEASWKERVISLQDLEKARDDVEKAKYGLTHARRAAQLDKESLNFELQTLRIERDRQQLAVKNLQRREAELQLRAPVDGIVGTLAVDNKVVVQQNAAVATVIDLSRLEIDLSVADSYADDLAIGSEVSVKFAGNEFPATLVSVSPEVVNSTVNGRVRFEGDQPPGLRQNQRVSARIILESKPQALIVERGPFYDTGGGRVIYKVDGDIAQRTEILTGSTSVSYIEILQGLNAGDQVVISEINRFEGSERVLLRN